MSIAGKGSSTINLVVLYTVHFPKVDFDGFSGINSWRTQRKPILVRTYGTHSSKWCLNLKLMSSVAYHGMRCSGFVTLPSERTLRDYTKYIKSVPGYQQEVVDMMKKEPNVRSYWMANDT